MAKKRKSKAPSSGEPTTASEGPRAKKANRSLSRALPWNAMSLTLAVGGLLLAWLGTRLLTRSPVVHVDSLRSVRAAFTRDEAAALATRAGLTSWRLTMHWPCRWRLVVERAA